MISMLMFEIVGLLLRSIECLGGLVPVRGVSSE